MNSSAQRLDELELQVVRQAADVVVALDVRGAGAAAGLDDVRVQRALHEELDLLALLGALAEDVAGRALEDRMNSRPMILRLVSGSVTPASSPQEGALRRRP